MGVVVVSLDGVYNNEGEKVLGRCKRCQAFIKVGLEYCVKCEIIMTCAWSRCNSKIEDELPFICPFTSRGFHREHWKIWKARGLDMSELSH